MIFISNSIAKSFVSDIVSDQSSFTIIFRQYCKIYDAKFNIVYLRKHIIK